MVVFVCHLKAVGGAGTRGGDTGCKQLCSLDPCSCVWAHSVPVSSSAALPWLPAHVHTATIAAGRAPGAAALCPCCPCGFAWVPCVDAAGIGGGESLNVSGWCYHTRHCSTVGPLSVGAACRRGWRAYTRSELHQTAPIPYTAVLLTKPGGAFRALRLSGAVSTEAWLIRSSPSSSCWVL